MQLDSENPIISKVVARIHEIKKFSAEIMFLHNRSSKVEYRDKKIENIFEKEEKGYGVRLMDAEGKIGFFSSNDFSEAGLEYAIERAKESLPFSDEDEHNTFYRPSKDEKRGEYESSYDDLLDSLSIDEMADIAAKIEKEAYAYSKKIVNNEKTTISRSQSYQRLANNLGLDKSYRSSLIYGMTMPVAGSDDGGEKEVGDGFEFSLDLAGFNEEKIAAIAKEGAKKAVEKIGAKSIKTGKYPILMNPDVSASLISSLLEALYGENVLRGKSLYKDSLGKEIAATKINLVNEATRKDGPDTVPFDDEGLSTRTITLIENGILKNYLHNLYSASFLNQEATASGARSYASVRPGISSANCHFLPGNEKPDTLMKEIKAGVLVNEVMGLHTLDPVSGDFSIGMSGQWIENGNLAYPVSGLAVAGNLKDLLMSIKAVADDIKFFLGGVGGSTMLLENISISGE